jgi:cation transport ATPase
MPSRKQRRRREKQQRHEWEEVYVDEEGREVAADEAAEREPAPVRAGRADNRTARAKSPPERARRSVDPPSWRRTFKRGLLFFPLMLITIFLIAGDNITTAQKIVQTLVLMAFFLPFSYFMDSVVWRSAQRRLAKQNQKKS